MSSFVRTLLLLSVAVLAACAQQETRTARQQQSDRDYGAAIGEAGDARTRAKAHTDLGAAYYELGNLAVALEEVRIALAADPTYPSAYNMEGLINMELKDNPAAEASFKRALTLSPQDPDINHNYGIYLCQTGRDEMGITYFMNAVRNPLYATPSKSWTAAGRCVMARNPKDAAEYLDRALRLDPNNLNALLPYADLQYRRGNLSEARALVARYHRAIEPNAESLWLALRIEHKLGDRLAENTFATQLRRRFAQTREFQELVRGNFE
jgi:type IV pilus assembly protein PilF